MPASSPATPPGAAPPGNQAAARLDWPRYYRVAWFFGRAFVSFILWDLLMARLPLVGTRVRRGSQERWRQAARRYRRLAIRFGGVLIKLGQFLSIRVDVLPPEITAELSGLQDEVPAEALHAIRKVITDEFGRPVEAVFAWLSPEPLAAASLAQVHRARLLGGAGDGAGQEVVVKVQRPGIERLVETDLAAIRLAARWLSWYRPMAQRVDLNRLYAEFAATTRHELDFVQEGRNCEHFAADFAADPRIYIARVYWATTSRRVLTLEDVTGIKITDFAAIEAAGIRRSEVAARIYATYLTQIFATHFVHADPHPGNLFLRPLPLPPDAPAGAPRPFQVVFVDFGMVAEIPEALRAGMREYIIALATRDAHRMVQAYARAGLLLPNADLRRIEELHDVLIKRVGGVRMGQLRDVALEQAETMFRDYRDLIYEMPFQVPADMLFAMRAVALLSGLATSLDPDFDPWAATVPFAEKLAAGELTGGLSGALTEIGELARLAFGLPRRFDRLLTQAERGRLTVESTLAPDHARALRRIEVAIHRQTWITLAVGLLVAGVLLNDAPGDTALSAGLLAGAGLALLWAVVRR